MAARAHPELVQRIVERDRERTGHGDGHVLVFGQSCWEFKADVRPACAAIEEFTGKRPVVYRPVRVPIGGASYWSLTPTPGLGPQTPHPRGDANVARLND
jgi:peptidoglycan/xylan/chitin deacetylase (PgdA/CDA1 family)